VQSEDCKVRSSFGWLLPVLCDLAPVHKRIIVDCEAATVHSNGVSYILDKDIGI